MAVCDSSSCCLSFFSSSGGWVVIDNDLATDFSPWLTSVWSTRRSLPQLPHCRRSAQASQRDSPVLHLNSSGIIYSFHHHRLELFASSSNCSTIFIPQRKGSTSQRLGNSNTILLGWLVCVCFEPHRPFFVGHIVIPQGARLGSSTVSALCRNTVHVPSQGLW